MMNDNNNDILQPLYELDELQIGLQHKMRYSVLLVPKIHYIQIKLTDKSRYVILCLLYDNLVKLSLVVTRIVIYRNKKIDFYIVFAQNIFICIYTWTYLTKCSFT